MIKSKLQQLKLNKKQARAQRKRYVAIRHEIVRFLIVCEGVKTEPNYFKALITDNYSSIREVTITGEGRTTVALVKKTKHIKEKEEEVSGLKFDRVWVVFDQDEKSDFNDAIALAKEMAFCTAWTNEAFELWYILHFEYLNSGINRKAYIAKLENIIREKINQKDYHYKKNDDHFYSLIKKIGNEEQAKKNAQRLRSLYNGKDYNLYKPCTLVDLLVEELEKPEKVLEIINRTYSL